MSINNLNTYLNVRDAHLRVVSGNVYAQAMNIGGINVETAHGLQSVSNTGNATSLTLEFANVTTGFVTTANAQIGRDLVVTGNATVSKELTVTSNAIVSSNLNVSDDLIVTNNILASNNLTVAGNLNVTTIRSDSNVVAEYTGPHDRPLRKYPEVAFPLQGSSESAASGATTFTYKSYTVTSNSVYSGTNYKISNAFDGTATSWSGNLGDYDSNGDVASGRTANYLQIQLPNAIKLENIKIISEANYEYANGPRNITLYGSNNGSDWVTLKTETDLPLNGGTTNPDPQTVFVHVNTTTKYLYYKLEISKIWISSGGATYARIGEWELYGHEEGSGSLDTTLKTVYNVPATTGTQLEVYYDGQNYTSGTTVTDLALPANNGTLNGGVGFDTTYKAFTFDGTDDYITSTLTGLSSTQYTMAGWIKVNTLDSTINTFFGLGDWASGNGRAIGIAITGDNVIGANVKGVADAKFSEVTTGEWYHVVADFTSGNDTHLYVNGKLVDTVAGTTFAIPTNPPLFIGSRANASGTVETARLFPGSIANFRLYSKALNADQVKELYDYQKDYFLGSKSQVTLYKGHLGVGVTEPSGQLELAGDERIQEYPPGPLTNYETHIPGHGVFCWYTPYYYKGDFETHSGVGMYAKDEGTTGWYGPYQGNSGYTGGNVYSGTDFAASTTSGLFFDDAYGARYYGAWTTFKLPYKINLKRLRIRQWGTAESINSRCAPEDGVILGSNDGTKWYHVHTFTGLQYGGSAGSYSFSAAGEYVTINCNTDYNQYVLITTRTLHYAFTVIIGELQWFGTPGPTTLDKGSLTLGRSLDVPRVSRYDVDTETPRPEKLVVYFDTTVNKSPTDISGKGNHGLFNNMTIGTEYSVAEKAFDFTDPNGVIYSGPLSPPMTGDKICSMSAWFKTTNASTVNQSIMWLGAYSIAGLLVVSVSNGTLRISIGSGCSLDVANVIESNKWYHVVGIKQGTGSITSSNFSSTFKLYLNGEPVTGTFAGTARTLSITTNYWYVGAGNSTGAEPFSGYISNPKLYDTILEPSEIKKLYNLGRTGRSMVISDTAVGIGQAPTAQLDVRGSARFDTFTDMLRIDHPGNQLSISRSDDNKNEFRWYAWGNGCNWFTPFTGKSIYVGRDGQTISEFDFYNVTTVKRGSSIISSSDDRLKRDEAFITNATDTLLKLKPQTYIKKHRLPENENENSDDIPEQFEAGLIAQDVWYDAPELKFLVHPSKDANPSETKPVSPDPNDPTQDPDYSSWGTTQAYINYEGLIPYLIKATQEQYEKTQSIKSELNIIRELQTENNRLKNKVAILENRQTHFNTLLVDVIGRIEKLERPT